MSKQVLARNNFTFGVSAATAYNGQVVLEGDLNGDLKTDILLYNESNGSIEVGVNQGNFNANTNTISVSNMSFNYSSWLAANSILNINGCILNLVNVTGSILPDLVVYVPGVSNDKIYVAVNNGGSFGTLTSWASTLPHGNYAIFAANFDNDINGRNDIVAFNKTTGDINVGINNGSSSFVFSSWLTLSNASTAKIYLSDFTNDGIVDLAVYNSLSYDIKILANNGFNFTSLTWLSGINSTGNWEFFVSDFDNDTKIDLVGFDATNGDITLAQNTGTLFASSILFHSGGLTLALTDPETFKQPDIQNWKLAIGNFSGSVKPEIMAYDPSNAKIWIGYNNGVDIKFNLWLEDNTLSSGINYEFLAADFYKDARCDILCVDKGSNFLKFGINAPHLEGYCWPLSGYSNQSIEFKTSGNGLLKIEFERYTSTDATVVASPMLTIPNVDHKAQYISELAWQGGCGWNTIYTLTIPSNWKSGYYGAKLTSIDGSVDYISFIVKPATSSCSKILLLANANTWQAYNTWCGSKFDGLNYYNTADNNDTRSKYSPYNSSSGPIHNYSKFSFFRPNPAIKPLQVTSDHLLRAELWVYTWLYNNGYEPDVITDLDLQNSPGLINSYKTLISSTHPEYWTQEMVTSVLDFMSNGSGTNGGNIVSIGGNSIYEKVEYDNNSNITQLKCYGGIDNSDRNNFLLAVANQITGESSTNPLANQTTPQAAYTIPVGVINPILIIYPQ